MDQAAIQSAAGLSIDGDRRQAPENLVAAMVGFEHRYGGLGYKVIGGNNMEYGLDGDPTGYPTPLGLAFTGILDGDWTWGVDVLTDGRTAMRPGRWPPRVIDRSVDQRLEKHALPVSVRRWPHRTFTCVTPTRVPPQVQNAAAPPPVTEATGPADLWFSDQTTAVEISLIGWPPDQDRWSIRYFASTADQLMDAPVAVVNMVGNAVTNADWCALCLTRLAPSQTCLPTGSARSR
jgi:hypothetical protein